MRTVTHGLALAVVLLLLLMAIPAQANTQIVEDSPQGRNVKAAADFLREMGDGEKADNILAHLRSGKLYYGPVAEGNGETSAGGDIIISPGFIQLPGENKQFDPERHFSSIVGLARLLYHEKIHVHQSGLFIAMSNLKRGETPHEWDAWVPTMRAMDRWARKLLTDLRGIPLEKKAERLALLKKISAILSDKSATLSSFIDENDCFGYRDQETLDWRESLGQLERRIREKITELETALEGEEVSIAPVEEDLRRERTAEEHACAGNRPFIPRDGEVAFSIQGKGIAAGEALDFTFSNGSDRQLDFTIPVGLAFVPSDPSIQKMIVGEPADISCPPHARTTRTLYAYCLDHGKAPPPRPEEVKNGLVWSVFADFPLCRRYATIVVTGNRLSDEGRYRQRIKSSKTYRKDVVQWALWYVTSLGSEKPVGKETLRESIDTQLAKLPKEKRPSEKQREEAVDTIWEHVDLTVKEAQKNGG